MEEAEKRRQIAKIIKELTGTRRELRRLRLKVRHLGSTIIILGQPPETDSESVEVLPSSSADPDERRHVASLSRAEAISILKGIRELSQTDELLQARYQGLTGVPFGDSWLSE